MEQKVQDSDPVLLILCAEFLLAMSVLLLQFLDSVIIRISHIANIKH